MPYFMGKAAGWAVITVLAASVAVESGAQAAVVTVVAAVPPRVDFAASGVDIFVSQFDPTLGSLTAVSVSLTGQLLPGLTLEQAPAPLALPPAQFDPRVTLLNVSSPPVAGRTPFQTIGITQFLGAESVPFVASGTRQIASGASENVNIAADLSLTGSQVQFVGSGLLDFYVNGRSNVMNPSLYSFYGQVDSAVLNGQVAITYTYTPVGAGVPAVGAAVPEPASLALLGAAVVGLCVIRSGRRSGGIARLAGQV
jgi:hypothetical protein